MEREGLARFDVYISFKLYNYSNAYFKGLMLLFYRVKMFAVITIAYLVISYSV